MYVYKTNNNNFQMFLDFIAYCKGDITSGGKRQLIICTIYNLTSSNWHFTHPNSDVSFPELHKGSGRSELITLKVH